MQTRTHPEQRNDELFLGHFSVEHAALLVWRTKRAGTPAMEPGRCERLPVFVTLDEVNNSSFPHFCFDEVEESA